MQRKILHNDLINDLGSEKFRIQKVAESSMQREILHNDLINELGSEKFRIQKVAEDSN